MLIEPAAGGTCENDRWLVIQSGQSLCQRCPDHEVKQIDATGVKFRCVSDIAELSDEKSSGHRSAEAAEAHVPTSDIDTGYISVDKTIARLDSGCRAGWYRIHSPFISAKGLCRICPAGKYSTGVDASFCIAVPIKRHGAPAATVMSALKRSQDNSQLPGGGAEPSSTSVATSSDQVCTPGKYSSSIGVCITCLPGRFSDGQSGATGHEVDCSACPTGKYTGRRGEALCQSCSTGRFAPDTGATKCHPCPLNMFQSEVGSIGCTNCPDGMKTMGSGEAKCYQRAAIDSGKVEIHCPPGRFRFVSHAFFTPRETCTDCPLGKFQPQWNQPKCFTCEAGE